MDYFAVNMLPERLSSIVMASCITAVHYMYPTDTLVINLSGRKKGTNNAGLNITWFKYFKIFFLYYST